MLDRVKAEWENTPLWSWWQVTIEHAEKGSCLLRMPVQPAMINADDKTLHGGVIATLIDGAIGAALTTVYDLGTEIKGNTTVELNVSYLEGIKDSPAVSVEANVIRRGRTLMVGEASVRDQRGRLCAVGRAIYMVFR